MTVVTISRQYGSGGTEIGERVCELLGYRYVDKLLMTQVAAAVGLLNQEVVDCSEEHFKVNNFLERLLFPGPHRFAQFSIRSTDVEVAEPMSLIQLDDARCANLVRDAIHTAYKQGDVVIVGRGGQATLRDRPDVLHVRVEAPIQYRILRIQEMEGVGPEEARSMAKRHDQVSANISEPFSASNGMICLCIIWRSTQVRWTWKMPPNGGECCRTNRRSAG